MNPGLLLVGAAALAGAVIALAPTLESADARLPTPATRAVSSRQAAAPLPGEPVAAAVVALRLLPPDAAPQAEAVVSAPAETSPTLVGLAFGGARPVAYVMAGGKSWRAGVGGSVGGWTLASIGRRDVTLKRSGEVLHLGLFGPRAAPPAPRMAPFTTASASPAQPAPSAAAAAAAPERPAAPASPRGPPPPANAPRYWVGPSGSMPPGYTAMPPGALPPPPGGRR